MVPYRMFVLFSFSGGLLSVALALVCHPALVPFMDRVTDQASLIDLVRERTRGDQLDDEVNTNYKRLLERRAIIRAVMNRQMNLIEGAARLLPYEADMPGYYSEVQQRVHGGRSPEENVCRYLIYQVRVMAEGEPQFCDAIVRDLQQELDAHIARNGCVVLPFRAAPV